MRCLVGVGPAAGAFLLLAASAAAAAESDMKVVWQDGLKFRTEDGTTEFRFGARVQNDWVFQQADSRLDADVGPAPDGTEFRRLYLEIDGVVQEVTELRAHVDFTSGQTGLRDVWVGLRKLPALGTVRIGHQYEPVGLDEQTSDRYLIFAERALPMALVPSRNTGVLATNVAGAVTWAAMVSRDTDDFGEGSGSGKHNFSGRIAATPWRADEGRRLLHLAASGSSRQPAGDEVRYSQRPENHQAPRLVDTGTLAADGATLLGLEAAAVVGSFTAQAEWVRSAVETLDHSDPRFSGWYAAASYFLTGESRPYSRSSATFGRVKPRDSFAPGGGAGAWELAARYSRLDLTDRGAGVDGGELGDVTLGLTWYANPHVRTLMNWVHADREDSGEGDALVARVEANF
jgi:phosphate-selective porin OprO/OprP